MMMRREYKHGEAGRGLRGLPRREQKEENGFKERTQ